MRASQFLKLKASHGAALEARIYRFVAIDIRSRATRLRARVHELGSDLGLQGLLGPQATSTESERAWEGKVRLGEALRGLLAWLRIIYGLLSVAFRAGKKSL